MTLLHVAPSDVEELAAAGPAGLLGRRRPRRPPHERDLRAISDEEASRLLDAARALLGRDCTTVARRGRVEREVVAGCADADLLVLARDGEHQARPQEPWPAGALRRRPRAVHGAPRLGAGPACGDDDPPRPPSTGAAENRRQAELVEAGALRPSSSIAWSRILNFWTLPVTVIGKESTNFTYRGTL